MGKHPGFYRGDKKRKEEARKKKQEEKRLRRQHKPDQEPGEGEKEVPPAEPGS